MRGPIEFRGIVVILIAIVLGLGMFIVVPRAQANCASEDRIALESDRVYLRPDRHHVQLRRKSVRDGLDAHGHGVRNPCRWLQSWGARSCREQMLVPNRLW